MLRDSRNASKKLVDPIFLKADWATLRAAYARTIFVGIDLMLVFLSQHVVSFNLWSALSRSIMLCTLDWPGLNASNATQLGAQSVVSACPGKRVRAYATYGHGERAYHRYVRSTLRDSSRAGCPATVIVRYALLIHGFEFFVCSFAGSPNRKRWYKE